MPHATSRSFDEAFTNPRVHTLKASSGILHSAAQWLITQATGESKSSQVKLGHWTILVPGRRAGHRLLEHLIDLSSQQKLDLEPPRITTLGSFPELLYTPRKPLASITTETLAWVAALSHSTPADRDSVIPSPMQSPEALVTSARELVRVHRELAGVDLGFRDVCAKAAEMIPGFSDHARWEALGRLESAYLLILESHGLWDRQTARRVALEKNEIQFNGRLVLLATVDLDLLQRRLLSRIEQSIDVLVALPANISTAEAASCFDSLGCLIPDAWLTREIPIPLNCISHVLDTQGQCEKLVEWLRHSGSHQRADEITIAVPDATIAPTIEHALAAEGVAARYGVERTARRSTPYQMLSAVFGWIMYRDYESLATLLRSPEVLHFIETSGETRSLELLDVFSSQHLPMKIDRAYLEQAVAESRGQTARRENQDLQGLLAVLNSLDDWLRPLVEASTHIAHGTADAASWTGAIRQIFATVYRDCSLNLEWPLDRVVAQSLELLSETLAEFETLSREMVTLAGSRGLEHLLMALWGTGVLPAPRQDDCIDLVGWLEVALDDSPLLALTSVLEGIVPSRLSLDPLLPESLRTALHLLDSRRTTARDAWILSLAVSSRETLLVIVPQYSSDHSPSVPSRLLFRRPPDDVVRIAQKLFLGETPKLVGTTITSTGSRLSVPRPTDSSPPVASMRVTEFKDYLACPYRYWLRHRLKLSESQGRTGEMRGADFGMLLHSVLEGFSVTDLASCTDPQKLSRGLCDILDSFSQNRFGSHPSGAVAVGLELAKRRLSQFASVQAERAREGWMIHSFETTARGTLIVDNSPMNITGRIDRIDHHPQTGRWEVLDYKTKATCTPPDRTHRTGDEWIDLQLPLYRHLLSSVAPSIDPTMLALGYFNLPADIENTGITLATWDAAMLANSDVAAKDIIRAVRQEIFWPRRDENSHLFPEFDTICQTHRIEPSDSENDT